MVEKKPQPSSKGLRSGAIALEVKITIEADLVNVSGQFIDMVVNGRQPL